MVIECNLHNIAGTQDIIRDGFDHICFHEWNVFVRRSMKNNLRLMVFKNLPKPFSITNISNNRRKFEVGIILLEFEQNLKDAIFAMPKQNQFSRVAPRNLAT